MISRRRSAAGPSATGGGGAWAGVVALLRVKGKVNEAIGVCGISLVEVDQFLFVFFRFLAFVQDDPSGSRFRCDTPRKPSRFRAFV
jgi:hypothetical protein